MKVTITATDKVGRKESITLMLDNATAERLFKAANKLYPDGSPCSELEKELGELYDADFTSGAIYYRGCLSPYQHRRLGKFYGLIYNKFYNYTLTIDVK